MKCARAKCQGIGRANQRGLCKTHYFAHPDQGFTDAAPVREHLLLLHAAGYQWEYLGELTGISDYALIRIKDGDRQKVQRRTANRVLSVPIPSGIGGDGLIDSTGTKRRLRGLAALGWAFHMVAAEASVSVATVQQSNRRKRITAANARAIDEVYRKLCMTPGPSIQARRWARSQRWVPPMAWDDEDIDNPSAKPNYGSKQVVWIDRYNDVRAIVGPDNRKIAERMGITLDAVEQGLRRHHRKSVAA